MGWMFDERARAAEAIFVRDQEARSMALHRGLIALAAWAAESMGLDADETRLYAQRLEEQVSAGMPVENVLTSVQTDLERAGKPALSTIAATVLAEAVAAPPRASRT